MSFLGPASSRFRTICHFGFVIKVSCSFSNLELQGIARLALRILVICNHKTFFLNHKIMCMLQLTILHKSSRNLYLLASRLYTQTTLKTLNNKTKPLQTYIYNPIYLFVVLHFGECCFGWEDLPVMAFLTLEIECFTFDPTPDSIP